MCASQLSCNAQPLFIAAVLSSVAAVLWVSSTSTAQQHASLSAATGVSVHTKPAMMLATRSKAIPTSRLALSDVQEVNSIESVQPNHLLQSGAEVSVANVMRWCLGASGLVALVAAFLRFSRVHGDKEETALITVNLEDGMQMSMAAGTGERNTPDEKTVNKMRAFAEQYLKRSDTYLCVDKGVAAVVLTGLAAHKEELGAPLCPCRNYEDKQAEANHGYWNCPCVPMRERKECHCMLFLTKDNDFVGTERTITMEEIAQYTEGMGM